MVKLRALGVAGGAFAAALAMSGAARVASASPTADCVVRKTAIWAELERRVVLAEQKEHAQAETDMLAKAGLRFGQSWGVCLSDVAAATAILDDVGMMLEPRQASVPVR